MVATLPTPSICIAVDIMCCAMKDSALHVLLVQRNDTLGNTRVLPGGFVEKHETLNQAAHRKMREETGYDHITAHQMPLRDAITRDPRGRVISIPYLALSATTHLPFHDGKHTKNATFFPIDTLPPTLYDHSYIITDGLRYLQNNILHTTLARDLFDEEFTWLTLQSTYEHILGRHLNTRNFRTKLLQDKIIIPTGNLEIGVGHRPAQYMKFAAPPETSLFI